MNVTTAVILGGGSSSRFYPFNTSSKSTVSLMGKSFFQRTIDGLIKIGIEKIIVIDDSKKSLEKSYQNYSNNIQFVAQGESLGMGNALLLAKDLILEDSFFVISSYHFEFPLFKEEMIQARNSDTDIVIVTKKDTDVSQFGGVSVEGGKVTVHEKSTETFASRIISLYLLTNAFLDTLMYESEEHYNFENAISNYSKGEVILLEAKRDTISLKFPWDLLTCKDYILKEVKRHVADSCEIAESAKIEGEVYIDSSVKIMDGAVITGPAYLGEGSYVGTNSILRDGVILEAGAVVGAGMEIKNSIIMDGATTHSGFIGDSIIGSHTKIAAGFTTGNVRLDRNDIEVIVKNEKINTHKKYLGVFIGSNSAIGIHVGTMPGVIIGNRVKVGPGTVVMKNIPDDVTHYTEFKEVIEKS